MTVSIFLNLLIPKNNPDFFENNQATACTEYLANTPPMEKSVVKNIKTNGKNSSGPADFNLSSTVSRVLRPPPKDRDRATSGETWR